MSVLEAPNFGLDESSLDSVPVRWRVGRLKDIATSTASTVDKKSYEDQLPVKLCNYVDVYYNDLIVPGLAFMDATASSDEVARFSVRAGEVVITKDSESANDIGIAAYVAADLPGVVYGYHLAILRPRPNSDGRFIKRLFDSKFVKDQLATRANGLTRVGLGQNALTSVSVPIPPLNEQRQIGEYLDRETGQIDALIAKQEQLVGTLTERRQSEIAQAVTRGLDPAVALMTSPSQWFGGFPSHWVLGALKHYTVRITDGAHISPETEGGVYDFVSTRDVSAMGIDFAGSLKTSPDTYQYMVRTGCRPRAGDILFSKDGTIGRTVLVDEDREFVVASSLIIISPDPHRMRAKFLNYLYQSPNVQDQVRSLVKGAGLPRLSIANLMRIVGIIPPVAEQDAIAEYLDEATASIDALIAKAREMTAVLRERRQALISAAVTGKIDARGL